MLITFVKYLPLLLKGKSIADIYQEETGQNKPWYMSRRFIGAVIVFIGAVVSVISGVEVTLDENTVNVAAENIATLIGAGIGLYGLLLHVIGWVRRQRP